MAAVLTEATYFYVQEDCLPQFYFRACTLWFNEGNNSQSVLLCAVDDTSDAMRCLRCEE